MNDCITRSKVQLRDYQIKAIKYINAKANSSLLVVHGTGTGKSLTALAASQCYLDANKKCKVVVVSPASLVKNFEKESSKYGVDVNDGRYSFYSFDGFAKLKNVDCSNTMLIIDEAHNLRNMGTRYKPLFMCALKCDKLLLLTATPFVNNLQDLKPIVYLLHRDETITHKYPILKEKPDRTGEGIKFLNFLKKYQKYTNSAYGRTLFNIGTLLTNKVSFYNVKTENYPSVKIEKVELDMTSDFYKKYVDIITKEKIFGTSPETFNHGYRRAVNSIGADYLNQKLGFINEIVKDKQPTLIFSNWIEYGINILMSNFDKIGITYCVIFGEIPANDRMSIVNNYNAGKCQVLIITKAGSEGLDLKNTRNIIVLDPVWNPSSLEQIIGRGVRFKSHASLPAAQRNVHVYLLILKSPKYTFSSVIPSGDELLYSVLEQKEYIKNDIESLLKDISI